MTKEESKLIIGISSRALFNLDESHKIYKKEGREHFNYIVEQVNTMRRKQC